MPGRRNRWQCLQCGRRVKRRTWASRCRGSVYPGGGHGWQASTTDSELDAMAVKGSCPRCMMPAGSACWSPSGRALTCPHAERRDAGRGETAKPVDMVSSHVVS